MAKPSKKAAKAKPVVKKPAKAEAKKPIVKVSAKGPSAAEKNRFTLYGFAGSTNTYTAALMLSLCRHPFSYIHVSLRDGAHKQPDFLVKNRFGQVPALRDGQTYYVQSAAILLHLAESLAKNGAAFVNGCSGNGINWHCQFIACAPETGVCGNLATKCA
jgi:glutathione S-transferase